MIQWKLETLKSRANDKLAAQAREHGAKHTKITYRVISKETGIALSSLAKIGTNKTGRALFQTIELLLEYFSRILGEELEIGDILEYKPKPKSESIT